MGGSELLLLIVPLVFWIGVFAVLSWALVTLHRIRRSQESIAASLRSIESELRRASGQERAGQ